MIILKIALAIFIVAVAIWALIALAYSAYVIETADDHD